MEDPPAPDEPPVTHASLQGTAVVDAQGEHVGGWACSPCQGPLWSWTTAGASRIACLSRMRLSLPRMPRASRSSCPKRRGRTSGGSSPQAGGGPSRVAHQHPLHPLLPLVRKSVPWMVGSCRVRFLSIPLGRDRTGFHRASGPAQHVARAARTATTSDRRGLGMRLAARDQRELSAPAGAQEAEQQREDQRRAQALQYLRVSSRGEHRVLSRMWGHRAGAGAWARVGRLACALSAPARAAHPA